MDFFNVKVSLKNTLYKIVNSAIEATFTALIYPGFGASRYPCIKQKLNIDAGIPAPIKTPATAINTAGKAVIPKSEGDSSRAMKMPMMN